MRKRTIASGDAARRILNPLEPLPRDRSEARLSDCDRLEFPPARFAGAATGLRDPVFTAHPTEITRHTIRLKRRRIAAALERLDQLPLAHTEAAALESEIMAEITSLWQTDEVRLNRPTVQDEVYMGLDYFQMVLFDTLPRLYSELEDAVEEMGSSQGKSSDCDQRILA